jgi:hypothetical protein
MPLSKLLSSAGGGFTAGGLPLANVRIPATLAPLQNGAATLSSTQQAHRCR